MSAPASARPAGRRGELPWCLALAVGALALRWVYAAGRVVLIDNDSGTYILRAREIAAGAPVFDPFTMPGYPLLIDLAHLAIGDWAHAARAAALVTGALLAPAAYLLGSRLYGRRAGLAAGVLAATNLELVDISGAELPEAPYALALLLAVGATIAAARRHGERGAAARWALAGVAYGVCYWIRPEGVFLLGVVPLLAALDALRAPARRRGLAPHLAAFLLGGALLVVPNVLATHTATGAWTVNGRTVWAGLLHGRELRGRLAVEEALRGLTPDGSVTRLEGGFRTTSAVRDYSGNLGFRLREYGRNLGAVARLVLQVLSPAVLLAALVGIAVRVQRRLAGPAELYVAGALLPWATVYPLYEVHVEKLATVLPLLLVWAALGLVTVVGTARRRGAWLAGALALAALWWAPGFRQRMTGWEGRQFEDDPAYRVAGRWIDEHVPPDAAVMARKSFVAAYAGRRPVMLPYASYPEVIANARRRGASVLVMEERLRALRPQLAFLYDGPPPPDLEPLLSLRTRHGPRVLLFRIRPAASPVSGSAPTSGPAASSPARTAGSPPRSSPAGSP